MSGEIKLHDTMDAKVWTDEFLRINPDAKDFGVMIGWFSNAIMAGYDHSRWKSEKEIDIWKSLAGELKEAAEKAFKELNEVRARDGVPFTHQHIKANVDENYFSSVVDELQRGIAKARALFEDSKQREAGL